MKFNKLAEVKEFFNNKNNWQKIDDENRVFEFKDLEFRFASSIDMNFETYAHNFISEDMEWMIEMFGTLDHNDIKIDEVNLYEIDLTFKQVV